MGTGRTTIRGGAVATAALLRLGRASTRGPETRVEGATTVSTAGHRFATPAAPVMEAVPPAPRTAPDEPVVDVQLEAEVFVFANRVRAEHGESRLTMRGDLIEIARRHALDMAKRGYFSHSSPEGAGPGERARAGAARFGAFAENLARVRRSAEPAELAITGWLESPGHRRNLLDEKGVGYRFTGVGVAIAPDGSVLLAQVFLR